MNNLVGGLKLVWTKAISFYGVLLGLGYLYYLEIPINLSLTLLFVISMASFDFAIAMINDRYSIRRNEIMDENISHKSLLIKLSEDDSYEPLIISLLITISIMFIIILFCFTNIQTFVLSLVCAFISFSYSYSYIPVRRNVLIDMLSMVTQGVFIPLIVLEISQATFFIVENGTVIFYYISFLKYLLYVMPYTLSTLLLIINNNLKHIDIDQINNRRSIVMYLGVHKTKIMVKYIYIILFTAVSTIFIYSAMFSTGEAVAILSLLIINSLYSNKNTQFTRVAVNNFLIVVILYSTLYLKILI